MKKNYKNVLLELSEVGDSIYKQSLRKEFYERLRTSKQKIDTIYNMAFYDIDLIGLNFNAMFLKYKDLRKVKKKTFLFTIKIKKMKDFYYQEIETQQAITNRLNEVIKLISKNLKELKLDHDIYIFGDTLNIILEKKDDCKTLFKSKIFEQTRDILGFRKFVEITPTYSREKKNILNAYRTNLIEIREQEKRLKNKK